MGLPFVFFTSLLSLHVTFDINALDEGGWSALSYAAYYNRATICSMLLKIGCDPMASIKGFPYHLAIQKGILEIAALFLPFWKGEPTPQLQRPPVAVIPDQDG